MLPTLTADTVVGGKLLRKGHKLMVSGRQLHIDSDVFGGHADQLDSARFAREPKLQRSRNFRPVGGGATLCPGRFLAKHMGLSFVALVLDRYDVCLAEPQAFPKCMESKPAIGIMSGDGGLKIRLRRRLK